MLGEGLFIVVGQMGLIMQTLKKQKWTEFSWRNKVYTATLSVEKCLEHGFPWNSRISNDYNCLHTIVTITPYKAF